MKVGKLIEDIWGISGDVNVEGQSNLPSTYHGFGLVHTGKKFEKAIQAQTGLTVLRIAMSLSLETS